MKKFALSKYLFASILFFLFSTGNLWAQSGCTNDTQVPTIVCAAPVTINASPGLCTGTTTLTPPTVSDNCSNFNSVVSTNTVTYEAWIFPNGAQAPVAGIIFRRDGGSATGLHIGYLNSSKIGYTWNDNPSTYNWTGGPTYVQNQWNHVALVIEPTKATIYLNGVAFVNNVANTAINIAGITRLGDDNCCGNRHFKGSMDEVRIWNYARTSAEINASMNAELIGNEQGLVSYYKFNQGTAGAANAGLTSLTASKGNNGTLNNFALSGSSSNWATGKIANGLAFDGVDDFVDIGTLNSVSNNYPSTIYPIGNTTVTWTATDAAGNTANCTQVVTVIDNRVPTITCPANIINVVATSVNGAVVNYTAPVGTDNCIGATTARTAGPASGATFPIGTTTVTHQVTDAAGLTAQCSFTVTVVGVAPVIACPANITVNNTAGQCGANVSFAATATGTPTPSITYAPASSGGFFRIGTTTVIATATNALGSTSCAFDVRVNDTQAPSISCPANITGVIATSANGAAVNYTAPVGTDNCTGASTLRTAGPASGATFPIGVTTVTHQVTDAAGLTASCSFTVTVVGVAPVIVCPANITVSNTPGQCSANVSFAATETVGIPASTISYSPASGSTFPVGTTTVTAMATNALGGSSCTFTVTVNDTQAPNAICQNATVILGPSGTISFESKVVQYNPTGFSPTNVPLVPVGVLPGVTASNLSQVGAPYVTSNTDVWPVGNNLSSATVPAGQYLTFTATFSTLTNLSRLVYTKQSYFGNGPKWATIRSSADGFASDLRTVSVNPVGQQLLNFSLSELPPVTGAITFRIYFYGAASNGDFADLVSTNRPNGTGLVLFSNSLPVLIDGGSNDNCGPVSLSASPSSFTCANVGPNNVVLTVKDKYGNTSTCTSVVTVVDNVAPTTPTLADVTGECSATATAPTTTDVCAGVITGTTNDPLSYSTQGTYIIHWTFDDGNGNSTTANQNVIVDDVTAPATPTLADVTGECSATATAPTTTDVCAGVITGTTNDPLSYSTQGTHIIHWTFDDGNGNSIIVNQNVIVDDVTAPETPTLANVTGECSATATAPTTTDNCTGTVIGTTSDPLSYSTQGTYIIHWTFDDGNGNSTTANQNVIVDDVTAPETPTLANVTGECSATATAPTTTDVCAGVITGTTNDPISYSTQGTYIIHWTFDDGNGNSIIVNQNVIVDDVTAPATPTLADVTGECSATATAPTTTDNCAGTVIGTTRDPLSYSTQGTYVINWTYDDGNGNVETQQQTVIVDDVTKPVPDVATLPTVTGECAASATAPTATDNCAGPIVGTTTNPTSYTAQGTYVITWSYDDGNGNVETQQQTVEVKDITKPKPDVTTLPDVTGECAASATAPTATDNCSGVITGTTTDPTSYTSQGTYVINWSYDDGNGNVETQQQTVIVKDVTDPIAVCKSATVTLVGGVASITVADVNNNSYDNCGIQSITASPLSFDCSNIGPNNVTLTVTDIAGNVSTCTAVVTVVGEIPTCSIASIPSSNVFTGGVSTNLYLGYGAQSTTLQVSAPASGAPYSYAWSGGTLSNYNTANPVFTATTAGTFAFTVEVTNKYGCKTTCSITICVTDIRVPGTNGNKVYVCHIPSGNTGNPQTLSISVNAVPAHVGLHGGDRLGTCDMLPCTAPSIVSRKSAVDATDEHGKLTVTVAPNPTSTYFTFRLHSEDETPVSIRIVNGTGQVLESANKVNSNGTIQMGSRLVNGMYFAEFMQGTDRQVIKVMKIGTR